MIMTMTMTIVLLYLQNENIISIQIQNKNTQMEIIHKNTKNAKFQNIKTQKHTNNNNSTKRTH